MAAIEDKTILYIVMHASIQKGTSSLYISSQEGHVEIVKEYGAQVNLPKKVRCSDVHAYMYSLWLTTHAG